MRTVAEVLRDNGIYSLALRMPGHGTVPSGLVTATLGRLARRGADGRPARAQQDS